MTITAIKTFAFAEETDSKFFNWLVRPVVRTEGFQSSKESSILSRVTNLMGLSSNGKDPVLITQ